MIAISFAFVIGLAARGSFQTTGEYDGQPRVAQFSLGMTLYVGTIVTLIAAAAFVYSAGETLFARQRQSYRSTQYEFSKTGQVLRVTRENGQTVTVTDLAGRAVSLPLYGDGSGDLPQQSLFWQAMQNDATPYNRVDRYILTPQSDSNDDALWYFVQSRRQIVGYANESRLPVGVLGPRGFAPMERSADAGQFPGAAQVGRYYDAYFAKGSLFYQFPQSIYRVNVNARTVAPLLSVAAPDGIRGVAAQYDYQSAGATANTVVVTTRQTLQVFPATGGRPLFVIPFAADVSQFPNVTVAQNENASRFFFWSQPPYNEARPSVLTEYDARGHLLRRQEIPPLPQANPSRALENAFGLLTPPALTAALFINSRTENKTGPEPTFLALSVVSGLVSAVLAFLVGRRCVFGKFGLWAWTVGVFWLGLPGVLLLLSLRAWPVREICPHCKQPRVVTRALCEHCAAPFAPPTPDGTEIFEDDSRPIRQSEGAWQGTGP